MKSRVVIAAVSTLFAISALAAPAPWYKWRSKLDGKALCTQTYPGQGWEKVSGPYKDGRCETAGLPGEYPPRPLPPSK